MPPGLVTASACNHFSTLVHTSVLPIKEIPTYPRTFNVP